MKTKLEQIGRLINPDHDMVINVVNDEGESDLVMIVKKRACDGGLVTNHLDLVLNIYSDRDVIDIDTISINNETLICVSIRNYTVNDDKAESNG